MDDIDIDWNLAFEPLLDWPTTFTKDQGWPSAFKDDYPCKGVKEHCGVLNKREDVSLLSSATTLGELSVSLYKEKEHYRSNSPPSLSSSSSRSNSPPDSVSTFVHEETAPCYSLDGSSSVVNPPSMNSLFCSRCSKACCLDRTTSVPRHRLDTQSFKDNSKPSQNMSFLNSSLISMLKRCQPLLERLESESLKESQRTAHNTLNAALKICDLKQEIECANNRNQEENTETDGNENVHLEWEFRDEIEAALGAEFAHLAPVITQRFMLEDNPDYSSPTPSFSQCTSGTGSTPASISSQTPGSASSPSTQYSTPSDTKVRKRKSADDDGPDDGDDDGDRMPPPKRVKGLSTAEPRFDCPFARLLLNTKQNSIVPENRSCAPNGLPLRNLYDHLRKAHYGCETCGLKLDQPRADKLHIRTREKDPSKCGPRPDNARKFEIGIDMWMDIELIYHNSTLNPDQKWIEWYKTLFPWASDYNDVDPRHHEMISFSKAQVPALSKTMLDLWGAEITIPTLNDTQQQVFAKIFTKTFEIVRPVNKFRQQRKRPGKQQAQPDHDTSTSTPHTFLCESPLPMAEQLPLRHTTFGNEFRGNQNIFDILNLSSMPDPPSDQPWGFSTMKE